MALIEPRRNATIFDHFQPWTRPLAGPTNHVYRLNQPRVRLALLVQRIERSNAELVGSAEEDPQRLCLLRIAMCMPYCGPPRTKSGSHERSKHQGWSSEELPELNLEDKVPGGVDWFEPRTRADSALCILASLLLDGHTQVH